MIQTNGATSLHLLRFICCVLAGIVAAWGGPARAAEVADRCAVPVTWPIESTNPQAFWDDDRQVSILRREDGGRFTYRIVGDVVELNPALFPALATEPDGALTDIAEISVDAREIIVDMPIRLADGVLKLRADRVRFGGGGSVSLIQPPKEREQALDIVAQTLDLSRARAVPFVFATQGWRLAEAPAWPAADAPKRMLRLKIGTIVPAETESDASKSQLKRDPVRWLHNRTADQGFDSGMPKEVWSAGYDITIGDAGAAAYDELFRTALLWPDAVANKVLRLRSRGAFDPAVDAFLRAKVEELLPRFDLRNGRHSAAMMRRIVNQIDDGVDPFGNGPFDVPLADLAERVQAFGKSLDEILGTEKKAGSLLLWDESRTASITTDRPANTAKQTEQIDRALREAIAERSAAGQRLTRNIGQLSKLVQDIQAKIAEVDALDADLRAEYDSRKSSAESYGGAVGSLSTVPVPVSFGLLTTAPAALGHSPIVTTGPGFYFGAKDGSWPMPVPTNLKEVSERYAAYATVLAEFGTAWSAAEAQFAGAIGDHTGKQRNQEALNAHAAAMRDVQAVGQRLNDLIQFGPLELKLRMDSFDLLGPEKNEKRFALVAEAEGIAAVAPAITASIRADLAGMRELDSQLAELGALRADIAGLKALPAIEAVQRQMLIDVHMRASLLAALARQAVLLRKGFFYATGEWPDLADDVIHFADDAATGASFDRRRAALFEPEVMDAALADSRAQFAGYYRAYAERRAKQLATFAEKKPAAPSVELFRAAYVDDSGRDIAAAFLRRQFLNAINRSMAAQVKLGRAGAGFAARPILIPIQITPPSSSEGVQTLLGVAVTKVRFRGESAPAGTVNLRIEHPRWGNVQINGECRRVIDVGLKSNDEAAGVAGYMQTIALPKGVAKSWSDAVSPDKPYAEVLRTAFPIDAPYYVYVQIPQPSAWSQPPVIDEIEIAFIKIGTGLQ